MASFKDRLKELRVSKEMTQIELADAIGVGGQAISQYERGVRRPDFDVLELLCDYFNVSADYILGNSDVTLRFVDTDSLKLLNGKSSPAMIPLYSAVSAGAGAFADSNVEGFLPLPPEYQGKGDYFGLRVKGDSMEPAIMDGDIVIVKKDPSPAEGKTVIAVINGYEGFCKKLVRKDDLVFLMSNNPSYDPKIFTPAEIENIPVSFLGTVVRLIRDIE